MKHIAKSRKGSANHLSDLTTSVSTTPIIEPFDLTPDTPTIDMDDSVTVPLQS